MAMNGNDMADDVIIAMDAILRSSYPDTVGGQADYRRDIFRAMLSSVVSHMQTNIEVATSTSSTGVATAVTVGAGSSPTTSSGTGTGTIS